MRSFWSDPLATPRSRLVSFFLLYVSEGLPAGFTVTAVATQMRRLGVGPAEIGTFVAALYLPWAFKWAAGPIVDTFAPRRFGPRRFWIVATQSLMALTLIAAMPIDFAAQLGLFTSFLLVHNVFAATQDVAIDALACNVLPPEERGVANGFMFGGYAIGQGLGGGGVLVLSSVMPFRGTWLVVAAAILAITALVSWRLREAIPAEPGPDERRGLAEAGRRMGAFVADAWRAFTGTRAATLGVVLALLPMGATALGITLQSSLAVELGLDDAQVGALSLWSSLLGATCCVLGGWISDRCGRLRSVAVFIVLMSVPTVALAFALQAAGIHLPVAEGARAAAAVPAAVIASFWTFALLFQVANGLMYGAGTAVYMDITTPRVAATQFTAYMALCNLAYALSAKWQGHAIERLGYPVTLGLDAAVGLVCLAVLPFVAVPRARRREPQGLAPPSGSGPGSAIPEGVVP